MTSIKAEAALKTLSKITIGLAFFGLFRAVAAVSEGYFLELFIMKTLMDWLIFTIFLILSVVLEIAATHPEIRAYFTHIERGKKKKPAAPAIRTAGVETLEITPEMQKFFDANPDAAAKFKEHQEKQKAEQTTQTDETTTEDAQTEEEDQAESYPLM